MSLKATPSIIDLHPGVTEGGKESEIGMNDEMCHKAGFMLRSVARCYMWPSQGNAVCCAKASACATGGPGGSCWRPRGWLSGAPGGILGAAAICCTRTWAPGLSLLLPLGRLLILLANSKS